MFLSKPVEPFSDSLLRKKSTNKKASEKVNRKDLFREICWESLNMLNFTNMQWASKWTKSPSVGKEKEQKEKFNPMLLSP